MKKQQRRSQRCVTTHRQSTTSHILCIDGHLYLFTSMKEGRILKIKVQSDLAIFSGTVLVEISREINAVFLRVCKINVRFIISEKRKKMDFTLQLSTINAFKFIIDQFHCYGYVLWFGLSKKVVTSCIQIAGPVYRRLELSSCK